LEVTSRSFARAVRTKIKESGGCRMKKVKNSRVSSKTLRHETRKHVHLFSSNISLQPTTMAAKMQLIQEEKVFRLSISHDAHHLPASNNNSTSSEGSSTSSEMWIHRKIIDLFKHRDDFEQIDLNVRTSRGLSGRTRVDVSNALMHMKSKGKKLRRLTADIDYMDPSVHEFVLLACLWFEEICITSNPEFEQTSLSVGLAMAVRHALTCNQQCIRVLELTCGVTEETCDVLADAMANANQLEVFQWHLLAGRSAHLRGVLEGLQGKTNLTQLRLTNVDADAAGSLASVLGDSRCRITELELRYDWERSPHYNTARLSHALSDISNESVARLILDGIPFFSSAVQEDGAHSSTSSASLSSSSSTTRILALAFPCMETLSLATPEMPSFADFLDLPAHQLPQKLKSCYFPCTVSDVEQARNLVERLPTLVNIPDFESDSIVQHYLDWRLVMKSQQAPTCANVWPLVFERTNQTLRDHPDRRANMLYTLLQDFNGLKKNGQLQVVFPTNHDNMERTQDIKNSTVQNNNIGERDVNSVAIQGDLSSEDVFHNFDQGDATSDY